MLIVHISVDYCSDEKRCRFEQGRFVLLNELNRLKWRLLLLQFADRMWDVMRGASCSPSKARQSYSLQWSHRRLLMRNFVSPASNEVGGGNEEKASAGGEKRKCCFSLKEFSWLKCPHTHKKIESFHLCRWHLVSTRRNGNRPVLGVTGDSAAERERPGP